MNLKIVFATKDTLILLILFFHKLFEVHFYTHTQIYICLEEGI